LYEQDDPDWFLVGNGSQVGFVPGNYVEVTHRAPCVQESSSTEGKKAFFFGNNGTHGFNVSTPIYLSIRFLQDRKANHRIIRQRTKDRRITQRIQRTTTSTMNQPHPDLTIQHQEHTETRMTSSSGLSM